jgi:hypothetical protein
MRGMPLPLVIGSEIGRFLVGHAGYPPSMRTPALPP